MNALFFLAIYDVGTGCAITYLYHDKAKPIERWGRKASGLDERQPGCLGKVARLFCLR